MTKALPLTLALALTTSGLPVNCQERVEPADRPIGRAMAREALRFASEPDTGAQNIGNTSDAAWSKVRKLNPGAEITLTTSSQQQGVRYVLAVDESGMVVLNLSGRSIPRHVVDALRTTAVDHPQYFSEAEHGRAIALDRDISLDRDGVFVVGRNVARLDQLVERVDRAQIVELRLPYGNPMANSMGVGIGIGLGAGVVADATSHCSGCLPSGVVLGAMLGFMVGSILVSSHDDGAGVVVYPDRRIPTTDALR